MSLPVLVAGAGIGGLTAALALRRAGREVRVFERARALEPVGAGLTVQPNAVLALRALDPGLAAAVVAAGHVAERMQICDWRGRVLSEVPASALARAVGAPSVALHRAALHELLLEALGREAIETGATATGWVPLGESVALQFEDGREVEGAALIAADGLRSTIRAQLVGAAPPRYAGYTSWRGVVDGFPGLATTESWGRGRRFGVVPIGGERVYWFATANAPAGEVEPPERARARLLGSFAGWHAPIPALIAATPADAILRTDIADRPPAPRWGEGRVTLLGDAAHPMTPNLGQGACQAIEDAVVLGRCLAGGVEWVAALRRYEALRRPRVEPIVAASRRLGALAQIESSPLRFLRDALLRATPAAVGARQVAALWRFE